jgi:hypothetical protein
MATAADIRAQILRDTYDLQATVQALDTASKKTAILIEPRKHKAVPFVLQNLLECLPAEWDIQFFHGPSYTEWAKQALSACDPKQAQETPRITLKPCPTDSFASPVAYSAFVASREFIQQIPTEVFLIVQTDSMINPNRAKDLAKFTTYDYVGAPWPWDHLPVGNGGFSLRRKSALLKVLDKFGPLQGPYEDQFFSSALQRLGANLPTREVAREFAVEQLFHPNPIAFHKVWDHMPTRFDDLATVCPGLRVLKSLQGTE